MPVSISLKGENSEDKTKSIKILCAIVSGLKFKSSIFSVEFYIVILVTFIST